MPPIVHSIPPSTTMILSQFNSVVPYQGDYLLYNSFSNKFLVIKPLLRDLLLAARHESVDDLQTVHPAFYKALKGGGFVVDESRDEVDEVKKISTLVDMDESLFRLTINPTMNCNFKCWYCYETHIKKSRMAADIIQRTNAFITKTAASGKLKVFHLSWFGGEPLLYFEDIMLPILQHFTHTCQQYNLARGSNITTNGYLITEPMIMQLKEHAVSSIQITLDGNQAAHDQVRYVSKNKGSYQEIIRNIGLLLRHQMAVTMRINYTVQNILSCLDIIKDLTELSEAEKSYLLVDFHRVWQEDNSDSLSDALPQVIAAFKKEGFHINSHYSPNNVVNSCYADKKNSAVINFNGDIFKCTARDFTTAKREGYIDDSGDIIWENDSLNRRIHAKFHNKPCLSCRIMPLCNGGCSQHALEHLDGEDYCVYSFDEKEKDKIVIMKFEETLV